MTTATFPRWTRIAPPIAALWYAFGLSQALMGYMANAASAPVVIWLAYAAACIAGIVGSAMLFFTPARASLAFGISLISAAIYYVWLFTLGTPAAEDPGIAVMVLGVTLTLWITTRRLRGD